MTFLLLLLGVLADIKPSDVLQVCVTADTCPVELGNIMVVKNSMSIGEQLEAVKVQRMEILLVENTEGEAYEFDLVALDGCDELTFRSLANPVLITIQLSIDAIYNMSLRFIGTNIQFSALSYLEFGMSFRCFEMDNESDILNTVMIDLRCTEFRVPISKWSHFSQVTVSSLLDFSGYEGGNITLRSGSKRESVMTIGGTRFVTFRDTIVVGRGSGSIMIAQEGPDRGFAGDCRFDGFSSVILRVGEDNEQHYKFKRAGEAFSADIDCERASLSVESSSVTIYHPSQVSIDGTLIISGRIDFVPRVSSDATSINVAVTGDVSCTHIDLPDSRMLVSLENRLIVHCDESGIFPVLFSMTVFSVSRIWCSRVECVFPSRRIRFSKIRVHRDFNDFVDDEGLEGLLSKEWDVVRGLSPTVLERKFSIEYDDGLRIHGFGSDSSMSVVSVLSRAFGKDGHIVMKPTSKPSLVPYNLCLGDLLSCSFSDFVDPIVVNDASIFSHLSDHVKHGMRTIQLRIPGSGSPIIDLDSLPDDAFGYNVSIQGIGMFSIAGEGARKMNLLSLDACIVQSNWVLKCAHRVVLSDFVLSLGGTIDFSDTPDSAVEIGYSSVGLVQSAHLHTLVVRYSLFDLSPMVLMTGTSWMLDATVIEYSNVENLVVRVLTSIALAPFTFGPESLKGFLIELGSAATITLQNGWDDIDVISPGILIDNSVYIVTLTLTEPSPVRDEIHFARPDYVHFGYDYWNKIAVCVSNTEYCAGQPIILRTNELDGYMRNNPLVNSWSIAIIALSPETIPISLSNLENRSVVITGFGDATILQIDTTHKMKCTEFSYLSLDLLAFTFTGDELSIGALSLGISVTAKADPTTALKSLLVDTLTMALEALKWLDADLKCAFTVWKDLTISGNSFLSMASVTMRQKNNRETLLTTIMDSTMVIITGRNYITIDMVTIRKSDMNENNTILHIPATRPVGVDPTQQVQFSSEADESPSLTVINDCGLDLVFMGPFNGNGMFHIGCSAASCAITLKEQWGRYPIAFHSNAVLSMAVHVSTTGVEPSGRIFIQIPGPIQCDGISIVSGLLVSLTIDTLSVNGQPSQAAISIDTGELIINKLIQTSEYPIYFEGRLGENGVSRVVYRSGDFEIRPLVRMYAFFATDPTEVTFLKLFERPQVIITAPLSVSSYFDSDDWYLEVFSFFGIDSLSPYGCRPYRHVLVLVVDESDTEKCMIGVNITMSPSNLPFVAVVGTTWQMCDAFFVASNASDIGDIMNALRTTPIRSVTIEVADPGVNSLLIKPGFIWVQFSSRSQLTVRSVNGRCRFTLKDDTGAVASLIAIDSEVLATSSTGKLKFDGVTMLNSGFQLTSTTELESGGRLLYDRASISAGIQPILDTGTAIIVGVTRIDIKQDRWIVDSDVDFPYSGHDELHVIGGESLTITIDDGLTMTPNLIRIGFNESDRTLRRVEMRGKWDLDCGMGGIGGDEFVVLQFEMSGLDLEITSSTFPIPKIEYVNPGTVRETYVENPHLRSCDRVEMSDTTLILTNDERISMHSLEVRGHSVMKLKSDNSIVEAMNVSIFDHSQFEVERLHVIDCLTLSNDCRVFGSVTFGVKSKLIFRWNSERVPMLILNNSINRIGSRQWNERNSSLRPPSSSQAIEHNGSSGLLLSSDDVNYVPSSIVIEHNGGAESLETIKTKSYLSLFTIIRNVPGVAGITGGGNDDDDDDDDDCKSLANRVEIVSDVASDDMSRLFDIVCFSDALSMRFAWPADDIHRETAPVNSSTTADQDGLASQQRLDLILTISLFSAGVVLLITVVVIYGFMRKRFRVLDYGHDFHELV